MNTIHIDLNLDELTRFIENFNHARAEIVAFVPLRVNTATGDVATYRIFTRLVR